MRSPKRRKLAGKRMVTMNAKVEEDVLKDLVSLAPREPYGEIIAKLVKGAMRRREKRNATSIQISVVNQDISMQ